VTRRWNDRLALWNWRSSLVSLALFAMVIISAIGAWQVRESWLEHKRAVESTLDEYAAYAARAFFQAQFTEHMMLREAALAPVTGASAFDGDPLTLERVARAANTVLDKRYDYASDPLRGYYRLDLRTRAYSAIGAAADPGHRHGIEAALRGFEAGIDTLRIASMLLAEGPTDRASTMFAVQRTSSGRPIAIYGFLHSWRRSFGPMMEAAWPRTLLLPPSVLDAMRGSATVPRADTMIALKILERDGRIYYQSPRQFTSDATGAYTTSSIGMSIHAALHPAVADRLRREMLDDRRRRLQLALPLIAVLFAIAAILHLRRERELVRARRDFVASVSHELRTPLAQIRMFSETLLLRREDNEEERMRWIGIIGREARRLGDLVENILLFSHIDAARVRLEPERTDVGELVEEVVEAYVPIAESRRMRIVADAPSRIFAVVDPRALRQVVVNLVDNALKYGPAGQTVAVEVERDGTVARLAVSDEGPGVPRSEHARVWQPFVRLGKAGSATNGSGIGLAVVRSLVEQQGGSVTIEERLQGGAQFVVTLPLSAA
jgi:signal transduction histidine kinase